MLALLELTDVGKAFLVEGNNEVYDIRYNIPAKAGIQSSLDVSHFFTSRIHLRGGIFF